ncbi:MAG: fumarylacetoacetase, partial [Rhodocyclaceae bacterium]|nr:fumarylacetoacetase [Rhodocyclaceae bacterium]
MNPSLDETHDPALESWVESANDAATDFPIQNLPYGRFRRMGEPGWRIGVAIGDQVLDLQRAQLAVPAHMNDFMALGREAQRQVRRSISRGLARGSAQQAAWQARAALCPQSAIELDLPCDIGDYTDFYSGIHHATAVGRLFRPDNPLLPNYKWVPVGYHGRSSSILPSGRDFRRPQGQVLLAPDEAPVLAPTRRLDYELELGAFIGAPNRLGQPIPIAAAENHLFGLVLLNDWSARDIQAWEYQPLGPFLSKSFATSLSCWIVTADALAPFRAPLRRPPGDPQPLPYLDAPQNRAGGAYDIELSVWLHTAAMQAASQAPVQLSQSNYRDAYWTLAQLIAHHTVNGCNLRSGDLLGTGTLSGPRPDQAGCLLELTAGGKQALQLPGGDTRHFLLDGDCVIFKAHCERAGFRRIGFGICRGT